MAAATMLPTCIRSLRQQLPSKAPNQPLPSLRRAFSLYDQINLIDQVPDDQLRFQGYTDSGFTVNRVQYEGSLLIIGNLLTSWSPTKFSEINEESLSIFRVVRPVPEILIVGCGKYIQPVDPKLREFIRSTGMKLEAIDSRNAASTYNILNEEGRIVAAALLPCGITS
ncbi:NDUFAF3/Mth938 domain-containing protein [Dillenia turbinata]|uniref:NADH dehydrogenase [ubiquinone] 1 alpha subcomplex assembly factor 3 n=1 Tax=Dillenia turbinata TaxID=194707 RepID=A0AAN8YYH4_9MAGN